MASASELKRKMSPPGPSSRAVRVELPSRQNIYVYIQDRRTSDQDHYQKNYHKRVVCALGVSQIALTVAAIVAQLTVLTTQQRFGEVGAGIWAGIMFGVAGAMGIYSSQKPTNCTIVAFLVTSIIASILTVPLLAISWSGIVYETEAEKNGEEDESGMHANVAAFAALMFVSAVEALVSITSSAICCRACCCRRREKYARVYLQGQDQELPQYPITHHMEQGNAQKAAKRSLLTPRGSNDLGRKGSGGSAAVGARNLKLLMPGANPPNYEEAKGATGGAVSPVLSVFDDDGYTPEPRSQRFFSIVDVDSNSAMYSLHEDDNKQ